RGQVLKLGALLHDVAKPETRRLVQGRVRFFDHDVVGAERARAIGRRLRLPERALGVLERLVRHHLRPMHLGASGRLTNRARSRFYRDLREDTQDLLLLALADAAAVTGTSPWSVWRRALLIRDLLGGWQELQAIEAAPPLLRGEDVMHRLGLAPGPAVGPALARVREAPALHIVDTLYERDPGLTVVPALAAEMPKLVAPTTWEVKLRRGVKFHNGEDFDAESAKWSLERLAGGQGKLRGATFFAPIDRVE